MTAGSSKTAGKDKRKYITNNTTVACNSCEMADERLKVLCGKCHRWWHIKCDGGAVPETSEVQEGAWQCKVCTRGPDDNDLLNETDVTRTGLHLSKVTADSTKIGGPAPSTSGTKSQQTKGLPGKDVSTQKATPKQAAGLKHKDSSKPKADADKESFSKKIESTTTHVQPSAIVDDSNPAKASATPTHPPAHLTRPYQEQEKHKPLKNLEKSSSKHGSQPESKSSSRRTHRSSEAQMLELLDEQFQIEEAQFELKQELLEKKLNNVLKKQNVLKQASERAGSKSSTMSTSTSKTSLVEEWVQDSRKQSLRKHTNPRTAIRDSTNLLKSRTVGPTTSRPNASNQVQTNPSRRTALLNRNATVSEFVANALCEEEDFQLNLSKNQMRARQFLTKELPDFKGDPIEWPAFIARYTESTRRCGYTEVENLDRLSRCLKGRAHRAVRSELHKRNALPSVLATLRMLFGRPEIIYSALIRNIKDQPNIREDSLESLIPYSMSIKTLCETLSTADLQEYLFSPLLMLDLIEKLPMNYRIMWGNHEADLEDMGSNVNVDTFNTWLRRQAEIFTKTNNPIASTSMQGRTRTNQPKKSSAFYGTHMVENNTANAGGWVGYCHLCRKSGHITSKCSVLLNLDVDERWTRINKFGLCLKCLGKHKLRDCGFDIVCGVDGCTKPHHQILHHRDGNQTKERKVATVQRPSSSDEDDVEAPLPQRRSSSKTVAVHQRGSEYMFQIVPVVITNGYDREEEVFAFLDNGSEVTLMDSSLAKRLSLHGPKERLKLKWTSNTTRTEPNSMRLKATIFDATRKNSFQLKNIRTVDKLDLPKQSMSTRSLTAYPHLRLLPIIEYQNARPQLLIGLDNYQLMTAQETVEGRWKEPVAVRTRIGWTVYGNAQNADVMAEATINFHQISNEELKCAVDEYFSLENIGIEPPRRPVESIEDTKARKLMENGVNQREDGRYEVELLWKDRDVTLPNSLPMATARLHQFGRKIDRDGTRDTVNKLLKEYHEKGYLAELTEEEKKHSTEKTWYLPIFTVRNPNKPGKIRLVWDAAAQVDGVSLNDKLYTGPDLTASLTATLYKFRENQVAIGGDIEAMFHQILIKPADQEAQRCLWQLSTNDTVHVSKMQVMTFGAACSPSLAQYVKNKNARRFQELYPRATHAITDRHYVDDYLDSFSTIKEAKEVLEHVMEIHQAGGFNLRGIISNHKEVLEKIHQQQIEEKLLTPENTEHIKVLGMWWETSTDTLKYKLNPHRIGETIINCTRTPTKREVLRTLMMIFDPLGLIGYIILKGKLVLKKLWRYQLDWDDSIPEAEFKRWTSWISDLKQVTKINIPRWYFITTQSNNYELHVFVDAGEEAVAAVGYIVKVSEQLREVALVGSKTKVGPNKPTSIPRMELQAAVIGARLASMIIQQHSLVISKTFFWTDSRNVLCWLRSPKRFKVFVAHRVGEIRENTRAKDWKYVPTDINPADLGTKWLLFQEPIPSLWLQGPIFLRENEENWPVEPPNLPPIEDSMLEVRCNVVVVDNSKSLCPDWERFSKLNRLIRAQAYALRFFYWGKKQEPRCETTLRKPPNKEELNEALMYLIREAQAEAFVEEQRTLKKQGTVHKSSCIRTYFPFLDQQHIIRMKSRFQEADYLTYDQRCPIILPKNTA